MAAFFWFTLTGLLLLAGLLLPGAVLARALGFAATPAVSFTGSYAVLHVTVIALQLCGVPITLLSLTAGGVGFTAAFYFLGLGRRPRREKTSATGRRPVTAKSAWALFGPWTPLYALFWAAVLLRLWHQPLNGPDVEFRWAYLAEQMLAQGDLAFYPPRSDGDFLSYFWAESIPPGIAALHAWAFACAGSSAPAWTVPGALLQLVAVHELIWRTAEHFGGDRAARYATLAAAACPLLTWSSLLGQETGITALAAAGLAYALIGWRNNHDGHWAALAGVFALIGASAREYGLVFPLLGAIGLAFLRADRRTWLQFGGVAVLGLVWPLRTWLLTGNPFYSLPLAGLFPVNSRFVQWIEYDAATAGNVLRSVDGWRTLSRYILLFAPAAAFGWAWLTFAAVRRGGPARWALVAVATLLALWVTSVRYTNGGPFYSLRVTAPALALGAIAAGEAFGATSWGRRRLTWFAPFLLGILLLASLRGTLALPENAARIPWRQWPAFTPATPLATGTADELVARVARDRATHSDTPDPVVLSDSPGQQRRFAPLGIDVVPLWSPQADWLFDRSLPADELRRRWRDSRIRYVVVARWQPNLAYLQQHSRWQEPPLRLEPLGETSSLVLFRLRAAE